MHPYLHQATAEVHIDDLRRFADARRAAVRVQPVRGALFGCLSLAGNRIAQIAPRAIVGSGRF